MHEFEVGDRVGYRDWWTSLGRYRGTVTALVATPRPGIATGGCLEVRWDDGNGPVPEYPPNLRKLED